MIGPRTVALVVAAAVAAASVSLMVAGCLSMRGTRSAVTSAPSGVPQGQAAGTQAGGGAQPAAHRAARVSGSERLAAVCVIRELCRLLAADRPREAASLLAAAAAWPSSRRGGLRRLELVSARVCATRDVAFVLFRTEVRAYSSRPGWLHDGVNRVFFTLGRVGTTGAWLVTAVSKRPQPKERGPT